MLRAYLVLPPMQSLFYMQSNIVDSVIITSGGDDVQRFWEVGICMFVLTRDYGM